MPLTLYKRGKIYHYRGTVAGRRLRGSTGTAKKAAAERFISELEDKQWKGHFDGPGSVLTFAQAAILYRNAQKSTRFLERVENYWRDTLVADIKAGHVQKAAITLYPKASAATRNRHIIVPTQAVIKSCRRSGAMQLSEGEALRRRLQEEDACDMAMGSDVHGERKPAPWRAVLLHVPDRRPRWRGGRCSMGGY
jgi:hypothetical protein